MNAYTSSSSSSAMSAARRATGSSTTSASCCSPAGRSGVISALEQVSAEQIFRVRTLHVRSRVDNRVPLGPGRRIGDVERGLRVGDALAVGDHLVEGEGDATATCAGAEVDVGNVR